MLRSPDALEALGQGTDPIAQLHAAHETAAALLRVGRAAEDPGVTARLVAIVDEIGLSTLADLWSHRPAATLPGGGAGGPRGGGGGGGGASAMLAARPVAQPAFPDPQTFDAVVALIGEKREIKLQMDVQQHVRLVSFKPGAIVYESVEGAPVDLARRLSGRLKEWTGRTWLIAANGQGGGETLIEQQKKARAAEREQVEADPFVKAVLLAFPGAKLGEIKTLAPTVVTPEIPDASEDDDED